MANHTVYIVGAGPGDPELLTIKAHKLITNYAEVVIYDRLVPHEILDIIPSNIKRIYAGKSCRKHYMTQAEINEELVAQAKKGRKVVRLKGGDPFIFGRGGEEIEYLAENNVKFQVIPGISSAGGCASIAGIPLTHRGLTSKIYFITGHMQKGTHPQHNWKTLADPDATLIIYMGLANLGNICASLVKAGMSKRMYAAAIESGTTSRQRIFFGTVNNIAPSLKKLGYEPPTLIIIGKTVKIGQKLKADL